MRLLQYLHEKTEQFQDVVVGYGMGLLMQSKGYSESDAAYKIDRYRLSIFFINVYKLMILLALFALLGIFKYCAVLMVSYGLFRKFTMGVHLENTILCFISDFVINSCAVFLCIQGSILLHDRQMTLFMILCASVIICGGLFYKYAPAVTEKSPIKEKRKLQLRRYTFIALFLFLIVNSCLVASGRYTIYVLLAVMGLVLQTLNVLPVTFNIIKMKGW